MSKRTIERSEKGESVSLSSAKRLADALAVPLSALVEAPHRAVTISSFIGRATLTKSVARAISQQRLVTLTGPGGSGKTRLAVEILATHAISNPDGAWFVELDMVEDADHVLDAVRSALDVGTNDDTTGLDPIVEALSERFGLLVLDNCEHVLGVVRSFVETCLRRCPGIRVLATSREALRAEGELVKLVPPLATPAPGTTTIEDALASEAVALFCARASAVAEHFELTDDNVREVVSLCVDLDGLPLALELAAGNIGALSISDIAARLPERLDVLTDEGRATARHRSLGALVEWSFTQLDGPERELLQRMSLFNGGWTLEAAIQAGLPHGDDAAAIRHLQKLVDVHLVRRGAARRGRPTRYSMLSTVRESIRRTMSLAALAQAKHARLDWLCRTIREQSALAPHREQRRWLLDVDDERANVITALAAADTDLALRVELASMLGRYWDSLGSWRMGIDIYDTLLAEPDVDDCPRVEELYLIASMFRLRLAEPDRAEPYLVRCLDVSKANGHTAANQRARIRLARAWVGTSREEEGRQLLLGVVDEASERGEASIRAAALSDLARSAVYAQEYEQARSYLLESLQTMRAIDHSQGIAGCLQNLAAATAELGKLDEAITYMREAIGINDELGDQPARARGYSNLGRIYLQAERIDDAKQSLARSADIRFAIDDRIGASVPLRQLGTTEIMLGRLDAAETALERALACCDRVQTPGRSAIIRIELAEVALRRDRVDRAAEIVRDSTYDVHRSTPIEFLAVALATAAGVAHARGKLELVDPLLSGYAAIDVFSRVEQVIVRERLDRWLTTMHEYTGDPDARVERAVSAAGHV